MGTEYIMRIKPQQKVYLDTYATKEVMITIEPSKCNRLREHSELGLYYGRWDLSLTLIHNISKV